MSQIQFQEAVNSIRNNDFALFVKTIKEMDNINEADDRGLTLVHFASMLSVDSSFLIALFINNANIKVCDKNGNNAFAYCLNNDENFFEIFNWLKNHSVSINNANNNKETIFHKMAVCKNDKNIGKFSLFLNDFSTSKKEYENILNTQTKSDSETALHRCVAFNNIKTVQLLLNNKANPYLKDLQKKDCFDYAENFDMYKALYDGAPKSFFRFLKMCFFKCKFYFKNKLTFVTKPNKMI